MYMFVIFVTGDAAWHHYLAHITEQCFHADTPHHVPPLTRNQSYPPPSLQVK